MQSVPDGSASTDQDTKDLVSAGEWSTGCVALMCECSRFFIFFIYILFIIIIIIIIILFLFNFIIFFFGGGRKDRVCRLGILAS